jgi:hypothetical protein
MFYLFLANDLGTRGGPAHGGFMKARLALVPPLIWLACLRESANTPIRFGFRALTMASDAPCCGKPPTKGIWLLSSWTAGRRWTRQRGTILRCSLR